VKPDPTQHIKHLEFVTNLFDRALAGVPILDGEFGDRDLDAMCGYPEKITNSQYVTMYRRQEIANRVVDILPNECWKDYPNIWETEEERETEFEKAVDRVAAKTDLFSYLHRVDRISGIGRFGILFLGFDDGQEFDQPAPGFDETGPSETRGDANILYYRVFGEGSVSIMEFEDERTNPRYGQPRYYSLTFQEHPTSTETTAQNHRVHWSRVVHVADNLIESEIFGAPRMEPVYNRLLDLRKVVGGSAEMFWKGAFPGLSFEVDPKHGDFSEEERQALREDVRSYAEGLQRYITMVGVSVKSLEPQVADPTNHTKNLLMVIAMNLGVPMQTFMGSQQGQLDSPQDAILWRERIALRKERHVTPKIIRPTIDRLIQAGVLPEPSPQTDQPLPYMVRWQPMAPLSIIEQAEVAKSLAEALARYATSGAEALIPLPEFLGKVMGYSAQTVEAIMSAPKSEFSPVLQQLAAVMSGSANGNIPNSIPNLPKPGQTKDPSKTPVNVQQRANE
jgi:hypothetical protein